MSITTKIQTFNEAFKVAWDLSVENANLAPSLGPKLGEAIRKIMKEGARDPAEIGRRAACDVAIPEAPSAEATRLFAAEITAAIPRPRPA